MAPEIRPNYFSAPEDMAVTLEGIRLARRIFTQPAMADVVVAETVPGLQAQDDEALTAIRADAHFDRVPSGRHLSHGR